MSKPVVALADALVMKAIEAFSPVIVSASRPSSTGSTVNDRALVRASPSVMVPDTRRAFPPPAKRRWMTGGLAPSSPASAAAEPATGTFFNAASRRARISATRAGCAGARS